MSYIVYDPVGEQIWGSGVDPQSALVDAERWVEDWCRAGFRYEFVYPGSCPVHYRTPPHELVVIAATPALLKEVGDRGGLARFLILGGVADVMSQT